MAPALRVGCGLIQASGPRPYLRPTTRELFFRHLPKPLSFGFFGRVGSISCVKIPSEGMMWYQQVIYGFTT
ncbi:MAG: hypothetical protein CL920_13215 [Deltaproteobacteria bacterium]|nr:hypothetical protein [Deltaproteobacteria bacterium]MBU49649.1 hypothetical protein [Deltaproteobacteria bacterium]